jgi:hypothetical protein
VKEGGVVVMVTNCINNAELLLSFFFGCVCESGCGGGGKWTPQLPARVRFPFHLSFLKMRWIKISVDEYMYNLVFRCHYRRHSVKEGTMWTETK